MLRGGFGARTAKSLSSTSAGKQTISDRGTGADSVIRAISGAAMAVWLDADDIAAAHGAALASWTAKEGNAPVQAAAGKRPTLDVDGLNSRPAAKFDNTNDCLTWAGGALIASAGAKNTVASVSTSANALAIILELGTTNYYQRDGLVHGYLSDNPNNNRFWSGMGEQSGAEDSYTLSTKSGVPNINNAFVSVYDRSTAPEDTLLNYVSGAPTTDADDVLENTTTNAGWNDQVTSLGARANGGSVPFNGHIRELIVLSRAIDAAEAFRLGKALMFKSGITNYLSNY